MFDFLKRKIHLFLLGKLIKEKPSRVVPQFDKLKSIAVLFYVGDESVWSLLLRYAKLMEQNGKKVWLVGYQPNGVEIDYIISFHHAVLCNEKKDVSLFGVPKHEVMNAFYCEKFDLLIDATGKPNFFSQYVAMRSKALFTVSYNSTTFKDDDKADYMKVTDVFDFSISGGGKLDVSHFISNIVQYVKMFN